MLIIILLHKHNWRTSAKYKNNGSIASFSLLTASSSSVFLPCTSSSLASPPSLHSFHYLIFLMALAFIFSFLLSFSLLCFETETLLSQSQSLRLVSVSVSRPKSRSSLPYLSGYGVIIVILKYHPT